MEIGNRREFMLFPHHPMSTNQLPTDLRTSEIVAEIRHGLVSTLGKFTVSSGFTTFRFCAGNQENMTR